jgi:hypothetical protein
MGPCPVSLYVALQGKEKSRTEAAPLPGPCVGYLVVVSSMSVAVACSCIAW